jgi:hypothetical protein
MIHIFMMWLGMCLRAWAWLGLVGLGLKVDVLGGDAASASGYALPNCIPRQMRSAFQSTALSSTKNFRGAIRGTVMALDVFMFVLFMCVYLLLLLFIQSVFVHL